MSSLPPHGQLQEIPFPHLLLRLWRERFTGALDLKRGRFEKRILLSQGVPVFVESNQTSETLGVQLLDAEQLTREQYARVVDYVKDHGGREGAALLKLNLLDPKELFQALKEQVRRRVVDCFSWPEGRFVLDRKAKADDDAQAFRLDPFVAIQEGVTTHWNADRVLADLGARLDLHPIATEHFDSVARRLRPGPQLDALLAALDPKRTFGEALYTEISPELLGAAWVLTESGALEFQDGAPVPEDEAEEASSEAAPLDIEIQVESRLDGEGGRTGTTSLAPEELDDTPLSPEAEALKKQIIENFERIQDLDHYELLGLDADAKDSDIKRSYFQLAKRVHPDALARIGLGELRREANELFARIAQAYQTLSRPERRKEYDASRQSEASTDASRVAQAETLFRKGEVLIKVGNFAGAADFLRPCVELWPDEADYQAALGWALYKKSPSEPEEALAHLERADLMKPEDPVVLFRLGVVVRKMGNPERAESLLEQAKSLEKKRR